MRYVGFDLDEERKLQALASVRSNRVARAGIPEMAKAKKNFVDENADARARLARRVSCDE